MRCVGDGCNRAVVRKGRQAGLCFVGEEQRLGRGLGFPALSTGTAQDVSFFLSFFFFPKKIEISRKCKMKWPLFGLVTQSPHEQTLYHAS